MTRQLWKKVPPHARANYAQPQAPGTPLKRRSVDILNDEEAFGNFLVVRCEIGFLDWLQMEPDGHLRAKFTWNGQVWNAEWVTA